MGSSGRSNKTLFAIVGAGALVAIAIVVVAIVLRPTVPTATTSPTATVELNQRAGPDTATGSARGERHHRADGHGRVSWLDRGQHAAAARNRRGRWCQDDERRQDDRRGREERSAEGSGGGAKQPDLPKTPDPPKQPASLGDALAAAAGQPNKPAATDNGGGAASAPFDRGAAAASIGGVNVQGCKKADGPTGSGHVKITFAPNGQVSSAVVDSGPFPGTAVGGCIAGKFRGAHVPAFGGAPMTVGKSFTVN